MTNTIDLEKLAQTILKTHPPDQALVKIASMFANDYWNKYQKVWEQVIEEYILTALQQVAGFYEDKYCRAIRGAEIFDEGRQAKIEDQQRQLAQKDQEIERLKAALTVANESLNEILSTAKDHPCFDEEIFNARDIDAACKEGGDICDWTVMAINAAVSLERIEEVVK